VTGLTPTWIATRDDLLNQQPLKASIMEITNTNGDQWVWSLTDGVADSLAEADFVGTFLDGKWPALGVNDDD
jgi:hypothetical protein